jgi:hypothetical protein
MDLNWLTTDRGRRLGLAGVGIVWLIIIGVGALIGRVVSDSQVSAWLGMLVACVIGTAAFGVIAVILTRRRRSGRL